MPKVRYGLLIALLGVIVLGATQWIGSSVDPDGYLREPFVLMVIGRVLFGIGVIWMLIALVLKFLQKAPRY